MFKNLFKKREPKAQGVEYVPWDVYVQYQADLDTYYTAELRRLDRDLDALVDIFFETKGFKPDPTAVERIDSLRAETAIVKLQADRATFTALEAMRRAEQTTNHIGEVLKEAGQGTGWKQLARGMLEDPEIQAILTRKEPTYTA